MTAKIPWTTVVLLGLLLIRAQNGSCQAPASSGTAAPYQPAVPAASTVNAYGGGPIYGGASTAAGSAMNGMAGVISAKGDYNLSTSAAAVNMTQAQRNEIENRQQWTNTYFDMRATNRAARAAEAGPRPTMEQIARTAHYGAPRPLGPSQMDPVTGKLDWPAVLQDAPYAPQRAVVDQLVAKQVRYGGLSFAEQTKARQSVDAMFVQLKIQIKDVPPAEYAASRSFLQSLSYFTSKSQLN